MGEGTGKEEKGFGVEADWKGLSLGHYYGRWRLE